MEVIRPLFVLPFQTQTQKKHPLAGAFVFFDRTTYLNAPPCGAVPSAVIHLFTLGSRSNKCGCLVYLIVGVAIVFRPFPHERVTF